MTTYVLGGGIAAAFFILGKAVKNSDTGLKIICPLSVRRYEPICQQHTSFMRPRKYMMGIGGNAHIWGGRLRNVDRETAEMFGKLNYSEREYFVNEFSSASGLNRSLVRHLLCNDCELSERYAHFVDREMFLNHTISILSKYETFDATVTKYTKDELTLNSGEVIDISIRDEVVGCMGFFGNARLLGESAEIPYTEHVNMIFDVHSSEYLKRFIYQVKRGEPLQLLITLEDEQHQNSELSVSQKIIGEKILNFLGLGNKLDVLVQIPAQRILRGTFGALVTKVLNQLSSPTRHKVAVHLCQSKCPKVVYDTKNNSISILKKDNELLKGDLERVIKLIDTKFQNRSRYYNVVDANHQMDADYQLLGDVKRIDTGLISMTGNPTFTLCVRAYCMGVSSKYG